MQANIDPVDVVHVQEGRDRIQINEVGIQLLYGIAITAFFACVAAFFANLYFGKGIGNWGDYRRRHFCIGNTFIATPASEVCADLDTLGFCTDSYRVWLPYLWF